MSPFEIAKPLTLPCGLTLPNRLVKAAMAEGWGDRDKLPHADLVKTYSLWAEGGWGMILTGNVQIDAAYLGTPEDNAVNNDIGRTRHIYVWEQWASAASGNGTAVIMQLNHPGRQSTIGAGTRSYLAKSIAPSAVPVVLGQGLIARAASAIVFGIPKEMSLPEIEDVVRRFADAARMAHEAGFAGVQVHAAHGYLLAQFLSSKTNKRTDAFGGTPRKRAKIVIDIIRAIRNVVPNTFCVGVKVNSVDHQSPGDLEDCLAQLKDVINTGIDFLEISGGTYENPLVSDYIEFRLYNGSALTLV
jgi:2,4-dienoyl-CoA reductase-like NADH-dependent reductase (Old Yellow Enzyme family)